MRKFIICAFATAAIVFAGSIPSMAGSADNTEYKVVTDDCASPFIKAGKGSVTLNGKTMESKIKAGKEPVRINRGCSDFIQSSYDNQLGKGSRATLASIN